MAIKFSDLKAVDISHNARREYLQLLRQLGSSEDPRGKSMEITPQEAVLQIAKKRYGYYDGGVAQVEEYLNGLDDETSQKILMEASARLQMAEVMATGTVDVYVDGKKSKVYAFIDKETGNPEQVAARMFVLLRKGFSAGELMSTLRYEVLKQAVPSENQHEYLDAATKAAALTIGTLTSTAAGAAICGAAGGLSAGIVGSLSGVLLGGIGFGAAFYYIGMTKWDTSLTDIILDNGNDNLFIYTPVNE